MATYRNEKETNRRVLNFDSSAVEKLRLNVIFSYNVTRSIFKSDRARFKVDIHSVFMIRYRRPYNTRSLLVYVLCISYQLGNTV
jgi:hypothetical protein